MKALAKRQNIIIAVFIIAGVLLTIKIAQLQLFDQKYREQARRTTLDKNIIYPARGLIYDRNSKLLVTNNPIYDLNAIYNKIDPEMDTSAFCELLEIDKEQFIKALDKDWRSGRYNKSLPFTFLTRINPNVFARFQEHLYKYPGFYPVLRNVRGYPHQNAAHVLGYLGEVGRKQIEDSNGEYAMGDYIGINGIEASYEHLLKGGKGVKYMLKDNLGRDVGPFDGGALDSSAVNGTDIIASLDLELQKYGELLMQNKRGAIVAIEPASGEILSLISAPNYDPNILNLDRNRGKAWLSLLRDTLNRPSLDRSVMAKYPPGSIFKPIFSLIALQKGITYPDRTIYCSGEYDTNKKKGFVQRCHAHPTPYNVGIAIQHSCNSYYYQLMREFIEQYGYSQPGIGMDTLKSYLYDFGLGHKLGLDYIHENSGFIPSSSFYDNLYKEEFYGWRSTYILSLGIGQGELQLTTVQMANLAAIIANRGFYYVPHLVKSFVGSNVEIPESFTTKKKVRIDPKFFPDVIDGMEKAVLAGTAINAYVPGLDICGKTGTSQNPHGDDHSVFFAFAPKENPQIAIAVYVENAGFGGDLAAPIAGLMIEKYLNGEVAENRKWREEIVKKVDLISLP